VRRIVWAVLAAIVIGGLAYAERAALLTAIGGFLVVEDEPHPADAIVVLSGSLPDRILQAVDLYHAHLAPRIILTREPPLPGIAELRARGGTLPEHHEQNLAIAEQLGVPAAAITVIPEPAASTVAEAQAVVPYLRAQHLRTILLVTSKAHARRARLTFRALGAGAVEVAVCPSRYDPFTADAWWRSRAFVRRVVIEYGKLFNFALVDRWRLKRAA
jgi:uncharacterized SAM-binding protein YcdF (DUF218 family)